MASLHPVTFIITIIGLFTVNEAFDEVDPQPLGNSQNMLQSERSEHFMSDKGWKERTVQSSVKLSQIKCSLHAQ